MRAPSRFVLGMSCFLGGLVLGVTGVTIAAGALGSARFPDVPAGSYFDEAVGEMAELGVIRGRPDGRFDPAANVSRADVAVMMKRLRDEILGIEVMTTSSSSSRSSRRSSSSSSSSTSTSSSSPSSRSSSSASRNPAGSIRFTTANFTVNENESPAKITLIRTGGADGVVSVEYKLIEGTAKEGTDYIVSTGTLNFAAGETSRIFTIDIVDDGTAESVEIFTIEISNPEGGADISVPSSSTITVKDDDGASSGGGGTQGSTIRFAALSYSISEASGNITIAVERIGDATAAASVKFATSDITAKAGTDYTNTNGTLQFAANETEKTFSIPVANDSSTEGNKKVRITLSVPTGAVLDDTRSVVELIIVDDEVVAFGTGSLRFKSTTFLAGESAGTVAITVERTGGAKGAIAVDYETLNGTAKAGTGEDYEKADSTLNFREGETAKTFTVKILTDDKDDPDEKFLISLSNPTRGALLTDPDETTVTIQQ